MLDKLALILTIIGGINWGLIGIFQFDLVAWICGGQGSIISRDHLHDRGTGGYLVYFPAVPGTRYRCRRPPRLTK